MRGSTYLHNVIAGERKGYEVALLERLHPGGFRLALPLPFEHRKSILLVELAVRVGVAVIFPDFVRLGLRLCLLPLRSSRSLSGRLGRLAHLRGLRERHDSRQRDIDSRVLLRLLLFLEAILHTLPELVSGLLSHGAILADRHLVLGLRFAGATSISLR